MLFESKCELAVSLKFESISRCPNEMARLDQASYDDVHRDVHRDASFDAHEFSLSNFQRHLMRFSRNSRTVGANFRCLIQRGATFDGFDKCMQFVCALGI